MIQNQQPSAEATSDGIKDLLDCVASLEREMSEAEKKMDAAVAREAYGDAEYFKGCAHSYALASLRVKRITKQSNDALNHGGEHQ